MGSGTRRGSAGCCECMVISVEELMESGPFFFFLWCVQGAQDVPAEPFDPRAFWFYPPFSLEGSSEDDVCAELSLCELYKEKKS